MGKNRTILLIIIIVIIIIYSVIKYIYINYITLYIPENSYKSSNIPLHPNNSQ